MSIVSDVRELIDDAGVFYIDQHVYDAVNGAILEVWPTFVHDEGTATVTITANQEYLPIPSTILVPRRIWNNNREMYPVTEVNMEEYGETWRTKANGKPYWFIIWDTENFKLWPKSNGTYVYTIEGQKYPDFEIKKAVQYRAAASLVALTRRDLYQTWMTEHGDYMSQAFAELSKRFKTKNHSFKPGNRTTLEHSGDIRKSRHPITYL